MHHGAADRRVGADRRKATIRCLASAFDSLRQLARRSPGWASPACATTSAASATSGYPGLKEDALRFEDMVDDAVLLSQGGWARGEGAARGLSGTAKVR